ncbi:hypothetical protein EYR36_001992 [Pleurotus pulmonarius]|nr:hypothetical protein EYR36_001992 [Pleurotus pulmonarius]KAF4588258.1 hypothetical protein EYR38_010225 [Pleurotus pulmonarius]
MNTLTNDSVPEAPQDNIVKAFNDRFKSAEQVANHLNAGQLHGVNRTVSATITKLRETAKNEQSLTAKAVLRIEEHHLRVIFAALFSFGITSWRPDFRSTPSSFYNVSLESIALWTFEKAITSTAYAFMEVDTSFLVDSQLLHKLYLNFVWSYMRRIFRNEDKEKGSVARAVQDGTAYKRRKTLTQKRQRWLREEGYNAVVRQLVCQNECTSDDERGDNMFYVFKKSARNGNVTNFFRAIDKDRIDGTPPKRNSKRTKPLPREPHPNGETSDISGRVPDSPDCPLDWFDPTYFNRLSMRYRGKFVDSFIALPLAEDMARLSMKDWNNLPEDEFMKKYGDKVKAQYRLPTKQELDDLEDSDDDDDEDSNESESDANDAAELEEHLQGNTAMETEE